MRTETMVAMLFLILLIGIALYYNASLNAPTQTLKNVKLSEQILNNNTKIIQVSVIKYKDGNFTTIEYITGHGIFGEGQYDTISGILLNQTIKPTDIVQVNSIEKLTICKYLIKTKNGFVNNTLATGSLIDHYNYTADSYTDCGDYTTNTFKVIKQ